MIFILLLLASCGIAVFFKRQIEETIPVSVFLLMLITYVLAITNHLSRAPMLANLALLMVFACGVLGCVFKNKLSPLSAGLECIGLFKSIGFWAFILAAFITAVCFGGHFVTNWDDFNYWAMFPKNIYEADAMVSGARSCSVYKDYTPIVQLLYYMVFKSLGGFKEAYMFMSNNWLILVCMLPFFTKRNEQRGLRLFKIASALLFPAATMYQQLHCLGVDCILSVLFGYLLVTVIFEEKRDLFYYLNICLGMSVLILVKSAGILLVLIALIVAALMGACRGGRKALLLSIALAVPSLVCLISWRMFCSANGNTSYLSEKAEGSLKSGSFITLPDYAGQFFSRFAKEFASYNLNDGAIGITPLLCVAACILFACMWLRRLEREERAPYIYIFSILGAGFLAYLVSLIYTYLFVFEKWEALSLSSFDRYISIYLLGLVYLSLYGVAEVSAWMRGFGIIVAGMLITLNFGLLYHMLFPGEYGRYFENVWNGRAEVASHIDTMYAEHPEARGGRLLIVNTTMDNELEKYQQYEMVPTVTFTFHLDEKDESQIEAELSDHSLDYAYYYETGSFAHRGDGLK